jgi:hypothetical protein
MIDEVSAKFVKDHAIGSEFWVSGMYVHDPGNCPALILVEASPDVWQASMYVYSFLGLGPNCYFIHERIVWPVGTDLVYKFALVDETQLGCEGTSPVLPNGEEVDLWDFEWVEPRTIADLLCPHLTALKQASDVGTSWEELACGEGDFEKQYADIIVRETPDFWS